MISRTRIAAGLLVFPALSMAAETLAWGEARCCLPPLQMAE